MSCDPVKVDMNQRRAVLASIALGVASGATRTHAQPAARVWRIGFLGPSPDVAPHLVQAFKDGLRDFGYVEGRNITVEYRWTTHAGTTLDADALLARASELVAQKVDVLAVSIDRAALAAKKATATLPIVMINVTDPVALGLIASLARPGGNITGSTRLSSELIGKRLQLLLEIAPQAKRFALLATTSNGSNLLVIGNSQQAAHSRGVALEVIEANAAGDLEAAFVRAKQAGTQALLVADDGLFFTLRVRIAELALAQRLPAMFGYTEAVEAGGLMSYSASSAENYRRCGAFIDKILRGAMPANIPVEQPTRFELAINLKIAQALGIAIAPSLRARADRVVE